MSPPGSELKLRDHVWTVRPEGHQLNLVMEGPACEVESGLGDAQVREVVMRALEREGQVDLITLKGTTMRQYEGLAVRAMNHLLLLSKELERLKNSQVSQPDIKGVVVPEGDVDALATSLRRAAASGETPEDEPEPEDAGDNAPGSDRPRARAAWVEKNRAFLKQKVQELDCPKCAFFPPYVFETLLDQLQKDAGGLPSRVAKFASELAAGKKNVQNSETRYCEHCLGVSGAELESLAAKLEDFVQVMIEGSGGTTTSARTK